MYLRLADAEDGGGSSTEVGGASESRRGARRRTAVLSLHNASDGNGTAELVDLGRRGGELDGGDDGENVE